MTLEKKRKPRLSVLLLLHLLRHDVAKSVHMYISKYFCQSFLHFPI